MDTGANTKPRRKKGYRVARALSFFMLILSIVAAYFAARLIAENSLYSFLLLSAAFLLVLISVQFKQKMYTFEPVEDEEEQK